MFITRLGIRGIRSFSPDTIETVLFLRPLTLICGPNGAGKSTILECLCMALSGDLPPNSGKGQSFVSDPIALNRPQVGAEIRLLAERDDTEQLMMSRKFSVTATPNEGGTKYAFKANEITLENSKSNKYAHSAKIADAVEVVQHFLDVSSVMLNHVMLCHQDDNTWPLGDPVVLKKRFDEIFGSNRYSKIVEVLNVLVRSYKTQVINIGHEMDLVLKDLEYMRRLMSDRSVKSQQLSEIEQQLEELGVEIRDIELKLDSSSSEFTLSRQQFEHYNDLKRRLTRALTETTGKEIEDFLNNASDTEVKQTIEQLTSEIATDNSKKSALVDLEKKVAYLGNRFRELENACAASVLDTTLEPMQCSISALTQCISAETQHLDDIAAKISNTIRERDGYVNALKNSEQALERSRVLRSERTANETRLKEVRQKIAQHESTLSELPEIESNELLPERLLDLSKEIESVESLISQCSAKLNLCLANNSVLQLTEEISRCRDLERFILAKLSWSSDNCSLKNLDANLKSITNDVSTLIGSLVSSTKSSLNELLSRKLFEFFLLKQLDRFTEQSDNADLRKEVLALVEISVRNAKISESLRDSINPEFYVAIACNKPLQQMLHDGFVHDIQELKDLITNIEAQIDSEKLSGAEIPSTPDDKRQIHTLIEEWYSIHQLYVVVSLRESLSKHFYAISNEKATVASRTSDETQPIKSKIELEEDLKHFRQLLNQHKAEQKSLQHRANELARQNATREVYLQALKRDRAIERRLIEILSNKTDSSESETDLLLIAERKREEIAELDQEYGSLERTKTDVQNKIRKLKSLKALFARHNMDESQTLGNLKEEYLSLQNTLSSSLKQLSNLDLNILNIKLDTFKAGLELRSIEFDSARHKEIQEVYEKHKRDLAILVSRRDETTGRRSLLMESLAEIDSSLKTMNEANGGDIFIHFGALRLKKHVASQVYKDLELYVRKLECAILDQHAQKMQQLNLVLKQRWQEVYSGSDIEYISIESCLKAKSSYEYRVLMHKGSVVTPMRGRCSAGQRVLATILIRIALAEVLSNSFILLALDEPTTNLDSQNCESIAFAIARLVEIHRKDDNFQLILITHDETFINLMRAHCNAEYFYLVRRRNGGFSEIIQRSL